MPSAQVHPSDDVLHGFLLGKLSDLEEAEVESHFAGCAECQARAATVCPSDTFVELLASAGTSLDADSAAPAPTLTAFATPSLASTKAWDGPPPPPAADAPAILAGHSKYRVLRRLGVGGMGTVWLAEHTVMNRPVAVKLIRPDLFARPGATARFLREVQAAAKLHHPNIVTAFDAESVEGSCLLVMEFVEGETLSDRLNAGPLPIAEACRAVRDAARGLAHAHAAGLTHRDVKPGNLIRAADGTTKVLDFGLVGFGCTDGSDLTGENMVMGTPDYIAPEQAEAPRTADARSDVYALGCTLYHLLAGRVAFPADSVVKKIDAHRSREPDPMPGVPDSLATVLRRMMAKSPADRYQTAGAVAEALEPFCAPRVAVQPAPVRRRGRQWAVAAGVLLGLVALGAAGTVYKIHRDNEVIEIKTDDPDVEVVMKRNGELIRIVDTKTKQSWELDTKKMRLKPDGGELSIDLPGKEPLVIRRNGDVAVTIERKPVARPIPPAVSGRPDPITGEVRRFTHRGTVRCVAFSPDGKQVLSASGWPASDGTVRLWDVATGKIVWSENQSKSVTAVAFATDDRILVGLSTSLSIVDRKTGTVVGTFAGQHRAEIFAVAVSPDGASVLTGGQDGVVRLWDARTRKPVQDFVVPTAWISGVAFSPDGKLAAGVMNDDAGGLVRVWDLATGKQKGTDSRFARDIGGVGVAFARDGRHVLFAEEGTAVLWDFEKDRVIRRFPGGAGAGGASVAVSPDGRRLLAGGGDAILRLFDIESGKKLAEFSGHTDRIWGVAFSPNGRLGLSCSGGRIAPGKSPVIGDDHTVRLWELPEAPEKP